MPIYGFYPRLENGAALAFQFEELAHDTNALAYAAAVLAEHRSAVSVSIWRGERELRTVHRPLAGRELLSRSDKI